MQALIAPKEYALTFQALGDPVRLRILNVLKEGEVCVCHIQGALNMPQSTISRHLAYLRRAGLVETRKSGLWVHYRLAQTMPQLQSLLDGLFHQLEHDTFARDLQKLSSSRTC